MRYDLLAFGLRLEWLGTPRLSWADLWAVVQHRSPQSALGRSIDGEDSYWSLTDHLLAIAVDRLGLALWQNGGGKGRKPEPIPRPGTKPKSSDVSSRKFDSMTIADYELRQAERMARQKNGG